MLLLMLQSEFNNQATLGRRSCIQQTGTLLCRHDGGMQ